MKVVGDPTRGVAAPGAATLASVESAPVAQLVERLLDVSDNETAEVLAHHVGLAVSGDGSFAGGAAGVLSTLQSLGIETGSDVVHDGSGLSRHNRLSPATLLQVLQVAARRRPARSPHADHRTAGGRLHRLARRPVRGRGRGRARRRTSQDGHASAACSSLAGLVTGRDGTQMVFVLAVDKTGKARETDVEAALDNLAADLAACRCGGGLGLRA